MREGTMEDRRENMRRMDETQDSLYGVEHMGAWLMALAALVAGVVGVLTGFGIIDFRDEVELSGAGAGAGAGETIGLLTNNFWDAAMLLFLGITYATLAYALHSNDHHRGRDLSTLPDSEQGLWSAEHAGAYLMAVGALTLGVIGLLTGFNALSSGHDQFDGLIWIWSALGLSLLTTTLHAVRHHQVADEGKIIAIVEERVRRSAPATGRATTEPGTQRIP